MEKQKWGEMEIQIDIEPFQHCSRALLYRVASGVLDFAEDKIIGHHAGAVADTIVPILKLMGQID